jgi:hypothetical protein
MKVVLKDALVVLIPETDGEAGELARAVAGAQALMSRRAAG